MTHGSRAGTVWACWLHGVYNMIVSLSIGYKVACDDVIAWSFTTMLLTSVGIDLKKLGVRCRNVGNFAQGLKF